jgi:hypothetical protein
MAKPAGRPLATVTLSVPERPTFPAPSYASAWNVCSPLAAVVESQLKLTAPLLNCAIGAPSRSSSMRAIPDPSEATIESGTPSLASNGAISRTSGGVTSFATTTARCEEMARPSRRIAWTCTLCRPFFARAVFQTATQLRALHDFVLMSSMRISTRETPSPFTEPTIWTVPVAGDGTVAVMDTPGCANVRDAVSRHPAKDRQKIERVWHKVVPSPYAEAHVCDHEQPFLRQPGYQVSLPPDPWLCVPASRRVCPSRKGSPLRGVEGQGRCQTTSGAPFEVDSSLKIRYLTR